MLKISPFNSIRVAFVFLYSYVLSSLPRDGSPDFSSYLQYSLSSTHILTSKLDNISLLLFNEPLWLLLNSIVSYILSPDPAVRLIIFLSSFILAYSIIYLSGTPFFWALVILLLPLSIKNNIFHIRQGLSVSIFTLGFFLPRTWYSSFLLLCTPFIHSSFFFILPMYAASHYALYIKLDSRIRSLLFVLIGFCLSSLGLLIATLGGARQALTYLNSSITVSGLGFLLWLLVFLLYLSQGKHFLHMNAFQVSLLALYLATYWKFEFSGRLLESAAAIILLAGFQLTGSKLTYFKSLLLVAFLFLGWLIFLPYFT